MINEMRFKSVLALILLLFVCSYSFVLAGFYNIKRVSINNSGMEGNDNSFDSVISADGRYVAFRSMSSNLVKNDLNSAYDVFVYDRGSNQIERISVDKFGKEGNNSSLESSISSDGRYIAFRSLASNLVSGDTNNVADIFLYDRKQKSTERLSVNSTGVQANAESFRPVVSSDGRYVAFHSLASNLVSGDTNGASDVFVYDRLNKSLERVSVGFLGKEANSDSRYPSVSDNGRYVAFYSDAQNLVPDDKNGKTDIFVFDREKAITQRVSVNNFGIESDGVSYGPSISANGRYVAFYSDAQNLVTMDTNKANDVFVYDRDLKSVQRISVSSLGVEGNYESKHPAISADGNVVSFYSSASNLVPSDTNNRADVFVHNMLDGSTVRISINSAGVEGNIQSFSYAGAISYSGKCVVFESLANNLVPSDTNNKYDIFVNVFKDSFSNDSGIISGLYSNKLNNNNFQSSSYLPMDANCAELGI